jgi:hypothetical protein
MGSYQYMVSMLSHHTGRAPDRIDMTGRKGNTELIEEHLCYTSKIMPFN